MTEAKPADPGMLHCSKSGGAIPLGEAEMDFATWVIIELCHRNVFGTVTMRNALLELPKLSPAEGSTPSSTPTTAQQGGPRR